MSAASGAAMVDKVSGMVHIREDMNPPLLQWNAIDQLKTIDIPLKTLQKLQASKETSPKIILKVLYKDSGDDKSLMLTFNNRPTMNNIKDSLQTIVARQRTVIQDSPAPGKPSNDSSSESNAQATPTPSSTDPSSSNPMAFDNPESLSDASLQKNYALQQKLLLEDRTLRNIFTHAVMKFKLSPAVFWSTRVSQLRTFALTISQHRGPYNVLSEIKPVATADNQVNVKVTRTIINEIFDTYPVVKRAFSELVPLKFEEGEFWSRFFNSKLFRRLRGDKISSSERGDVLLDKYLYINSDLYDEGQINESRTEGGNKVNRFIDIEGNEDDHSETKGNMPDVTMRFDEELSSQNALSNQNKNSKQPSKPQENEMIILMKNMNTLSSKMVYMHNEDAVEKPAKRQKLEQTKSDALSAPEENELQDELNLHDLNNAEDQNFIRLNIKEDAYSGPAANNENVSYNEEDITKFLKLNVINANEHDGAQLTKTYVSKLGSIEKSAVELNSIIKQNSRNYRSKKITNGREQSTSDILPESSIQEIINFNITIMEFLSHFWKVYLNINSPSQLKKLFANLKVCKSGLETLKKSIISDFDKNSLVKDNKKIKDHLINDLNESMLPMEVGLNRAFQVYQEAVRITQENSAEVNGDGKRPMKDSQV